MSILHVNQIKNYLQTKYFQFVSLTQEETARGDADTLRYTRAFAAIAINIHVETGIEEACLSITDSPDDNGIDALYYDQNEKQLFIAQSKFHHDGNGTIEVGEIHKFLQGVKDLINARFDKFNSKIQERQTMIEGNLLDSQTRFTLIVAHTGIQNLSDQCMSILNEFLEEYNDISEIISLKIINQKSIHDYISRGAIGNPFNVDVVLHNWCDVKEPFQAIYGQIAASDLASWYDNHGRRLFSPNIRMYLGETEVNQNIEETLKSTPTYFWYLNNGITVLCDCVDKKPLGGNGHDSGIFECQNLQIVNGAQTVGSIHRMNKALPENLNNTRVWVRLISLRNAPPELAKTITRSNNTQNRIEKRDFVSLDQEQQRLHEELLLEKIIYLFKSGETRDLDEEGFDLTEATIAQACKQEDVQYTVQAKREIGKLWDDIERPPYKVLFNPSLQGPILWRAVQISRIVEKYVAKQKKELSQRDKLMITHGNRFLLYLVYQKLPTTLLDPNSNLDEDQILLIASECFEYLQSTVTKLFADSVLGSLFKNHSKCKRVKDDIIAVWTAAT